MRKLFLFSFTLLFYSLPLFPQWSTNPNTPLIVDYGQDPKICSDGNGGCYITYTYETTWYPKKLALQRLDKYGYRPWGTKKQILGELPEQWNPEIIEDGYGNAIIGYDDNYWNGASDFYIRGRVQKVDSSGNFLWSETGIRVSLSDVNHGGIFMVPDDEGGVIVSFGDNNYNYFVNRINSFGQRVWGDSGLFLVHYSMGGPQTIIKGDDQSYYFYLRDHIIKINSIGEIIRHDTLSYYIKKLCADGSDGIITLEQSDDYYPNLQLRARRFDGSGNNLWSPYILIAESLFTNNWPELVKNGNYFFYYWNGKKNGIDRIRQFQCLRLDGSKLFDESIPISPGITNLVNADSGKLFVIWDNNQQILDTMFAQMYDTSGNKLWDPEGKIIAVPELDYRTFCSDLNSGFIMGGTIDNFTIVTLQVSRNGFLGVVPVELISFTADITVEGILLKWRTASETNNSGFEIQKILHLNNHSQEYREEWEVIGFIEGAGSSTEARYYSFIDKAQETGSLKYRLKQIDYDGSFEYSNEIEITIGLPDNYVLHQNYPNPFNPSTTISFSLPQEEYARLTLFNTLGEEIRTLINEKMKAGVHEYTLDASSLSSGIYFYRLTAGKFTSTKKLVMVK